VSRQQITCSDLTTSAFPEQKYHFFSKLFNSCFLLYFPAVCFGCFKRKPLANMCKHTPNPFAEVPWYFGIGEQSGGKLTASLLIYVKVWNRDISSLHPLKILVRSNSQHSLFLHQEGVFFAVVRLFLPHGIIFKIVLYWSHCFILLANWIIFYLFLLLTIIYSSPPKPSRRREGKYVDLHHLWLLNGLTAVIWKNIYIGKRIVRRQ